MSGRFTKSAFAAMAIALAACQQAPRIGAHVSAPPPTGPSIAIFAAEVDSARRVVVTVQISRDGNALGLEAARALGPAFTLAALGAEPVSGLPAWRSLVLSGAETLEKLPVAGPGTPLGAVLENARQPGAETEGTWIEKGSGTFTYTFATALPQGQSLSETMRVGVFLVGVPGTVLTTSTLDFVPDHSPLVGRELVVDAACETCHGILRAHGNSRVGTKICVTCHTYQHADGQTVDPAAPASALPTTNPNPLELGRLVHRVHRGKNLPTLYVASTASDGTLDPAPQPYGDVKPPAPFRAGANKLPLDPATNLPDPDWIGRRFSVVGELSRERVFGAITSRADNGQKAIVLAAGVTFPRDYRSCVACHTNDAAQVAAIDTEISRRTCHGCHTDVWFEGAVAPATEALPPDVFHLAHPGGPQPDDSRCKDCHVPTTANPDVRVPMKEAHVPPYRHARYSKPVVEIVSVTNLKPGLAPTIVFKVSDRNGPIRDLVNPSPPTDGNVPASNVPRALSRLMIALAGPAAPDLRTFGTTTLPLSEYVVGDSSNPTKPVPTSDAEGRFSYTFPDTKKIPAGTDGTWLVVIEARRSNQPAGGIAPFWDDASKRLVWPYTGETISETADNAIAWVDTATGTLGSGAPVPRRLIVDLEKCNACHLRLALHGGGKNRIEYCLACHAPDKTDWGSRPKDLAGNTNLAANIVLAATYDNVEERSLHLKQFIHRIHTGGRVGAAQLATPLVYYRGPKFRDMGEFPGDLQQCTFCHLDGTYRIESVPADAAPTIANETGTIRHQATNAHAPDEPTTAPISAACGSCHGTAPTAFHMARYTSDGKEGCLSCHGVKGAQSVDKVHALPIPVVQPTP
jgi:OmcA/MtrC family decaheme c-type cytochrome